MESRSSMLKRVSFSEKRVYLGVRTCELFLSFITIVRVRAIVLTSLFSLFYVTCEFHRFLHRCRAGKKKSVSGKIESVLISKE